MTEVICREFEQAVNFLSNIGIGVVVQPGANGFLEGLRIKGSTILVSEPSYEIVGDLLHESGHIAVTPSMFREKLDGDITKVFPLMRDYLNAHQEGLTTWPENPICRAILQCSEDEALAWSFAAAVEIGVDTMLPFTKGFNGNGKEVHDMLSSGGHFGIHGLFHAKMIKSARSFPKMLKWMQI